MAKKIKDTGVVKDGSDPGGRVKRYQFSIQLFNEMFMTGNSIKAKVKEGWPKDAQIVGIHPDEKTYTFSMIVHSNAFPLIENGKGIPSGDIIFESVDSEPIKIPVKVTK